MSFFMILKVALRAIFRNKTRSLLTALGIIVGIAAVIAVVAIGQGAQAMMIKEISSIGNNIIMVFPGSRTQGGVHGGSGSSQTLTAEDGERIAQDLAHLVRAVTPVVRTGSQVIYQENNWSTQIQGVSIDFPEVRNWSTEDETPSLGADNLVQWHMTIMLDQQIDGGFERLRVLHQTGNIPKQDPGFRVIRNGLDAGCNKRQGFWLHDGYR